VRLLLDTNVFIWAHAEPDRLGKQLDLLTNPENQLFLSSVSAVEIVIKFGLGRLDLPADPTEWLPSRMERISARWMSFDPQHALALSGLPDVHRDPFDRILVAQSMVEDLALMTADRLLARYPVSIILVDSRGPSPRNSTSPSIEA